MSGNNAFSNYLSCYLISCHIKPAPWTIQDYFLFCFKSQRSRPVPEGLLWGPGFAAEPLRPQDQPRHLWTQHLRRHSSVPLCAWTAKGPRAPAVCFDTAPSVWILTPTLVSGHWAIGNVEGGMLPPFHRWRDWGFKQVPDDGSTC